MKLSNTLKLKKYLLTLAIIFVLLAVISTGCSINSKSGPEDNAGHETGSEQGKGSNEGGEGSKGSETSNEHGSGSESGEGSHGSEGNEGGEEDGTRLTLTDTYDYTRKGARLVMSYDKASNSFKGTVTNTTNQTLKNVRVEVHLSNGTELGPTTPVDLAPDQSTDVTLNATKETFDGWTPHAEVGASGS